MWCRFTFFKVFLQFLFICFVRSDQIDLDDVKSSLYIEEVVVVKDNDIVNYGGSSSSDEDDGAIYCQTKEDCIKNYTVGIDHVLDKNYSVVHTPVCVGNSLKKNELGRCQCEESYCLSKSYTFDDDSFYYCGPCGRVGSVCNSTCESSMATCEGDYCVCKNGGIFYEAYYCYIPYYGYEVALQIAISTCIIIALCLLIASVYNAIGFRRLRRMQRMRGAFGNRENEVRESPPGDTPPKYDDVVEELPSYQDAIKMSDERKDSMIENLEEGIVNRGFESDGSMQSVRSRTDLDRSFASRSSVSRSSGARPKGSRFIDNINSSPAITEINKGSDNPNSTFPVVSEIRIEEIVEDSLPTEVKVENKDLGNKDSTVNTKSDDKTDGQEKNDNNESTTIANIDGINGEDPINLPSNGTNITRNPNTQAVNTREEKNKENIQTNSADSKANENANPLKNCEQNAGDVTSSCSEDTGGQDGKEVQNSDTGNTSNLDNAMVKLSLNEESIV